MAIDTLPGVSPAAGAAERIADYYRFLESKVIRVRASGIDVPASAVNPLAFGWQAQCIRWGVRKGRCAFFWDAGLGKTLAQLEWGRLTGQRTLIVAPLSVARQTVREGKKFGYHVVYVRSQDQVTPEPGVTWITNYEMVDHFDAARFGAVVLDESSILAALDGATRRVLISMFADTPYKLCCTATPMPNDYDELAGHAEFLGHSTRENMLATFFVHDDQGWRLKKHAREAFFRWLASWGIALRRPSDLGNYSDDGYLLPPLNVVTVWVKSDYRPEDQLFFTALKGITDRARVRQATAADRVAATAAIVNASDEQWIVWAGLNDESTALARVIPGSVEVTGSDDPERKTAMIEAFQDGEYRVLVSKPKICGYGLNFQNCHNLAWCGKSDSWQEWYQGNRRCLRFGQQHPVNAYLVLSEQEEGIYHNLLRKEREAGVMAEQLIANVAQFQQAEVEATVAKFEYRPDRTMQLPVWLKQAA